ncbi:Na+-transporting methylmalonyl-CoA/oxaloacetate decarboxylase gamma subunit [Pseudoalteromonas sp. MBR-15]|jgi:Na+-transporting methylmalonyl-CoA/oxaloacetate decarboxylase gamma subunit
MPIIKTTLLLILASVSFTSEAQYNEAMCILLKQQMHEFRNNTSNRNYRSAARNYEKNCKNPTPVHNVEAFEKLTAQSAESTPITPNKSVSPTEHSAAIQGIADDTPAPEPQNLDVTQLEQATQDTPPTSEPELISDAAAIEPVANASALETTEPVQSVPQPQNETNEALTTAQTATPQTTASQTTAPQTNNSTDNLESEPVSDTPPVSATEAEKPVDAAPIPAEPAPTPQPAPMQSAAPSSSTSLLMPSLIVLLVLLVAGLFIVRLRKSKQQDTHPELEHSLLEAQALKAAANANKEAEELKSATAAILAEQSTEQAPDIESELEQSRSFTATDNEDSNDELSELARFSAERDFHEQHTDFADADQFNELELDNGETEPKDTEPTQAETLLSSSSFGFDEYAKQEPLTDDEPLTNELINDELESNSFESSDFKNDELSNDELEQAPAFTSSSSFGFDEYAKQEPLTDDEPLTNELINNELEQAPAFTSSSSFGFDEYAKQEPLTDDEPLTNELINDELENDELSNNELEQAPAFTSSSSFGFDEYAKQEPLSDDEPAKDDVPEYDLSSLMGDDLSFADQFSDQPSLVTEPKPSNTDDDISDDDLAKALQALEQELYEEPKHTQVEYTEQNDDETLTETEQEQEPAQQDDNDEHTDSKPHNPFANLSLDPAWDPNSSEKPSLESKAKQPKSQALIDAEERAKQLKTDD